MALYMDGGQACVQVFFIRANPNWGNRDYYPRTGSGAEAAEVLRLSPDYGGGGILRLPFRDKAVLARIADGLRKAGLDIPEASAE